jgi:hypothetical protein
MSVEEYPIRVWSAKAFPDGITDEELANCSLHSSVMYFRIGETMKEFKEIYGIDKPVAFLIEYTICQNIKYDYGKNDVSDIYINDEFVFKNMKSGYHLVIIDQFFSAGT